MLALLLGAWVLTAWYQSRKPLPEGLRMASPWVTVADSDLRLLIDTTTSDAYGQPLVQQQIFDETLRIIGAARRFIVLNAHLFNPYLGELSDMRATRSLSRDLRDALLTAKRTQPQLAILVIVDPVNDLYGSAPSADYAMLASAGIEIARTDLEPLRDSNALWSAAWRGLIRWWGHARSSPGWVPNPLAGGPRTVPLRAAARALNFKANHRKLLVADDGAGQYVALVGSANPHDASSLHTNIALALRGPAAEKVLDASLAVARFSGWRGSLAPPPPAALPAPRTTQLRLLTEGAIAEAIGERLGAARSGDQIMVTALYLADRGIIRAILAAAARGAQVR
ncbi:MAG: hypothetical protein NZM12_14285, partial [Steroidobacteraceae bacterium]|nr:hypothetical protein [Steroidobacteraceae bacterium]